VDTYASKEFSGLPPSLQLKIDKVLTIIKELLFNPAFDAAEFEKKKAVFSSVRAAKKKAKISNRTLF
jgi:predicted Zn-dependent peptidase